MRISSDRIEGCQVVLNIEAETEEMERALEGTYRRLVKQAVVPGFRKGKAPRPMLERHLGRTALLNDAWDRLVPELYEQAVKEQGIEVFGQPQVEVTQVDPLTFKATVPVRPVVELGDYRAIKVTPEVVEITGDKIDEALERLRRTQVVWEPVEREARLGDVVGLNVEGSIEGSTLLDKGSEWYHLSADSTAPVPGFAGQIVGMKAGNEKEFTLPLPEDHANPELAGKDCLFKVSISEVKEEHLPELNDEFAKSLEQDVETMDQLREKIAGSLKAAADSDARNKLERQVVEAVVGQADLEFPAVLVEREVDRMVHQQMMALGGLDIDEYLKLRNLTREQYRDQLRPVAEKRVANALILKKVAEEEKMEVSDSEVDAEVGRRVENAGEDGKRVQEALSSLEARESLRDDLLARKAIDLLVRIATT
ncbi:trigger factor [Dehalococcoidia bacterium]|nr:trigger factor [Dehalococcoidia bacterium]MCL0079904.1 trigger factor [Dehalococcoidia bacterium]MCL0093917.1 trigger factor [Dehalococcoidia bacterium]MCL0097247.1 trigger factor [Dehalococcoidia bacterium]